MKVELWAIGKTSEKYLEEGMAIYEKRLKHYLPFQWTAWPDVKIKTQDAQLLKKEEGKMILSKLHPEDYLVLLDERGREMGSEEMARWMEKKLGGSEKKLVFLIGGAYGFSQELYDRAQYSLSLSRMTFSHQMVRLFMLEQLYRAMTILRNEPYHNPVP
jgi:23S rRNA (pseudouridine1915-N3)-methyltransferase